MVPRPKFLPKFYRINSEPCDMMEGPCACGTWHTLKDWPDEEVKIAMKEFKTKTTIKPINLVKLHILASDPLTGKTTLPTKDLRELIDMYDDLAMALRELEGENAALKEDVQRMQGFYGNVTESNKAMSKAIRVKDEALRIGASIIKETGNPTYSLLEEALTVGKE